MLIFTPAVRAEYGKVNCNNFGGHCLCKIGDTQYECGKNGVSCDGTNDGDECCMSMPNGDVIKGKIIVKKGPIRASSKREKAGPTK